MSPASPASPKCSTRDRPAAEPLTTEATLSFLENVLGLRRADRGEQVNGLRRTFAELPPERFPLITAHATELTVGDGRERLRTAIDVVVDGLLARAARR